MKIEEHKDIFENFCRINISSSPKMYQKNNKGCVTPKFKCCASLSADMKTTEKIKTNTPVSCQTHQNFCDLIKNCDKTQSDHGEKKATKQLRKKYS